MFYMAFQTPITIKEADENIHGKKYLLPSIQREVVWYCDQIQRLFWNYWGATIFTTSRQIPRIVPSGNDFGYSKVYSIVPCHPVYLPVPSSSLPGEWKIQAECP